MINELCNGDITKKKFIEETFDIGDYIEWSSFKKYRNYIEIESSKRYQKK